MQTLQGNILPDSYAFVHTTSLRGQQIFFYPLCAGVSHLQHYDLTRLRFDSFLVMLVTEGTLFLDLDGHELTARAGDVVLLDCYRPHRYGTHRECRIEWVHFDGPQARAHYELAAAGGPLIHPASLQRFRHTLEQLLELFRQEKSPQEAVLSCRLVELMTELLLRPRQTEEFDAVELAVSRIMEDPAAPLTLEELARYAALSPCYLCRVFKEKTGLSPHDYLIRVRVDQAKYLLKFTDLPMKDIAQRCGFSNASSFSNTFRRLMGVTPLTYRREDLPSLS